MAASNWPLIGKLKIIGQDIEKKGDENLKFDFDLINLKVVPNTELKSGAKIVIHANRGTLLLNGVNTEVKTEIPFLTPWKQVERAPCDLEKIEICQTRINMYYKQIGVAEGSKHWNQIQTADVTLLVYGFMPFVPVDQNQIATLVVSLYLILDDMLDNNEIYKSTDFSTTEITQSLAAFVSISYGEDVEDVFINSSRFPYFKTLCQLFKELRKKLILKFGEENINGFLKAQSDSILACGWETRGWCSNPKETANISALKREYYHRRELTIGSMPLMELACLYYGVRLSEQVRRDPLFNCLCRHWCRINALVNDLFSIKKDMENQETNNNIFLLRSYTKPLHSAIEKTMKDVYETIAETSYISVRLREKFNNSSELEQLNKFINVCNTAVDGNTIYSVFAARYKEGCFSVDLIYSEE